METEKYKKLRADSDANNDSSSCTVLAGCVAFDLDYKQGNKLLERYANRRKGRGLYRRDSIDAYKKINRFLQVGKEYGQEQDKFEFKVYDQTYIRKLFTGGRTMTVNNCMQYLNPKKRYILYTTNHAVGVKNGIVHDWSHGKKKPVADLIEITCNDDSEVKRVEKVFKMGGFGAVLDNL